MNGLLKTYNMNSIELTEEHKTKLEELRKVLKLAFTNHRNNPTGYCRFYQVHPQHSDRWFALTNGISLPTQSVKDFLEPEFKRGDKVLVRDLNDQIWKERTFFEKDNDYYVCYNGYEKGLYSGWKQCKSHIEEPVITELSIEEIAKKFNLPVDQIRIKK